MNSKLNYKFRKRCGALYFKVRDFVELIFCCLSHQWSFYCCMSLKICATMASLEVGSYCPILLAVHFVLSSYVGTLYRPP